MGRAAIQSSGSLSACDAAAPVSDRPVPGNHQASRCEREDANAVKTNGVDGSSLKVRDCLVKDIVEAACKVTRCLICFCSTVFCGR